MKARFLSLAMVCVLFSVYANAQTNKHNTISKGYYSIGNNAEKLSPGTTLTQIVEQGSSTQKGYYTIGSEKQKPSRVYKINRATSPTPVRKGYYSIGTNAEKLN